MRALSIVSVVVKVLETTTTSVSSGLSPSSAVATSTGSTFAKKRSWLHVLDTQQLNKNGLPALSKTSLPLSAHVNNPLHFPLSTTHRPCACSWQSLS